jgi:hypothetical protein
VIQYNYELSYTYIISYCTRVCMFRYFTNFFPEDIFDGIHASIVYSIMQRSVTSEKYQTTFHIAQTLVKQFDDGYILQVVNLLIILAPKVHTLSDSKVM